VAKYFEHGDEHFGFVTYGLFLDKVSDHRLLFEFCFVKQIVCFCSFFKGGESCEPEMRQMQKKNRLNG
jgi:hypothetical protein